MALIVSHRDIRLVLTSLVPSSIGLTLSVCFAIIMTGLHVILTAFAPGTAISELLGGESVTRYTRAVSHFTATVSQSLPGGTVLTFILWCFVGLCVYFLLEFAVHTYQEWYDAQKDIQYDGQRTLEHPSRRAFMQGVLWRIGILVIAIISFILVLPLLQWLLATGSMLTWGQRFDGELYKNSALAIIGWTVLAHYSVILTRLFLQRTRLFS